MSSSSPPPPPPPPLYARFQLDPRAHIALAVSDLPRDAALPRCALRGSLDPTTGIFYKAPEHHTRIRTLQACEKCRVRKAKCSGDHPVCERCRVRGLTCQYAPERRTRRWAKPVQDDAHHADVTAAPKTSLTDDSRAVLFDSISLDPTAERDPVYVGPAIAPVDGIAADPAWFHHHHPSGPGPGPPVIDDHPFSSDTGSPAGTPSASTSLSASPVLTRPSSRGLPTPINSYPSSPFTLASVSPTLGPYADPHAYPLFSAGVDQCEQWNTDMTWREVKDGSCPWEEGNAFLDMDAVL